MQVEARTFKTTAKNDRTFLQIYVTKSDTIKPANNKKGRINSANYLQVKTFKFSANRKKFPWKNQTSTTEEYNEYAIADPYERAY